MRSRPPGAARWGPARDTHGTCRDAATCGHPPVRRSIASDRLARAATLTTLCWPSFCAPPGGSDPPSHRFQNRPYVVARILENTCRNLPHGKTRHVCSRSDAARGPRAAGPRGPGGRSASAVPWRGLAPPARGRSFAFCSGGQHARRGACAPTPIGLRACGGRARCRRAPTTDLAACRDGAVPVHHRCAQGGPRPASRKTRRPAACGGAVAGAPRQVLGRYRAVGSGSSVRSIQRTNSSVSAALTAAWSGSFQRSCNSAGSRSTLYSSPTPSSP